MRKRTKIQPLRVDVPLECQSSEFGEFDEEQVFLLENGALDCVLIENASEIMRQVMMLPNTKKELGSIEKVLKVISEEYEGCGVLPSETFPLQVQDDSYARRDLTGTLEDYNERVAEMKKHLKKLLDSGKKCIFAVLAVMVDDPTDEGDVSGHYGAFYYNSGTKDLTVFDSMQGRTRNDYHSYYSEFFAQLGENIFNPKDVLLDKKFSELNSLQLTGGFSDNWPLILRNPDVRYLPAEDVKLIMLQSTESQNHFCYMWSIWAIHVFMMGDEPSRIADLIKERRLDPLVVIKRYIWALFHYRKLKLVDKIPPSQRDFFKRNFPVVWTNDPLRQLEFPPYVTFDRFSINPSDLTCNSLQECFEKSFNESPVLYIEDATPLTPKTKEYLKCIGK